MMDKRAVGFILSTRWQTVLLACCLVEEYDYVKLIFVLEYFSCVLMDCYY